RRNRPLGEVRGMGAGSVPGPASRHGLRRPRRLPHCRPGGHRGLGAARGDDRARRGLRGGRGPHPRDPSGWEVGTMSDITFRSDMRVTYIDHMGDDRRIAQAARVSTAGLDNDREKYVGLVRALIRDGHWSPLESCTMTIAFDVPAFTRDQIIRHRSMSFSVFSLRYSEAKPVFWVPSDDRPLVQVGK